MVTGFTKAVDDINEEANRVSKIHYEVTGDAKGAIVMYSTLDGDGMTNNQATVNNLPWSMDLEIKGLFKGGSLSVSTDDRGGTVRCAVTVDDEKPKTATASGQFATATCDGF